MSSSERDGTECSLRKKKVFLDLPNEVIVEIFKALIVQVQEDDCKNPFYQKKDISDLRLTCRRLADLGARYLVEHVSSPLPILDLLLNYGN